MNLSLDGVWELSFCSQDGSAPVTPEELRAQHDLPVIEAQVPGNVELDLIRAGLLPDIEKGDNIYATRKFECHRWWYHRKFITPSFGNDEKVELVFDGLDCLAIIWINNRQVGSCDNMLVEQRFDVTEQLHPESGAENEIYIRLDSPVLEARKNLVSPGYNGNGSRWDGMWVRKAPHMFGWDIMPRIVSAGIWKSVRLEPVPLTRWRSVYWVTRKIDLSENTAELLLDWDFQTEKLDIDELKVRVKLSRSNRLVFEKVFPVTHTHDRILINLEDVDFWWPSGYGEPALYDATVTLEDVSGNIFDSREERIGIRTTELRRSEITSLDGEGEFVFVINGEKIFAKGTNWVPLDALHSRDHLHLQKTFDMVVELHCNMIRCWGGNVYEDHEFFRLCDANGIMVWQDFAFACLIYPSHKEMLEKAAEEAEKVVRKLRNHPSLVLWAGNNEIDESYKWAGFGVDPNTDKISREILAEVVRREDPARDYLPSSPYRSPEMVAKGNMDYLKPEDHLWGPRKDAKSDFYTKSPTHFVSEYGFHGCPNRETLEEMLDPDSVWPWENNEQWLTKAVRTHPAIECHNYRIPLMAEQIEIIFGDCPDELDDYILASQITQAEAFKFMIERWRMGKWRRTGILWWNLRDGWPIISDAIVDYYYRRKLAYSFVRRAQNPICVMCGEQDNGGINVVVSNDTFGLFAGKVLILDLDSGEEIYTGSFDVDSNSAAKLAELPSVNIPAMWWISWTLNDGSEGCNHYLAGPRPYDLKKCRNWFSRQEFAKRCD